MNMTPLPPPADDYDTPWKDAVTRYFPEFIAFYFPDAARRIDWSKGYAFLDQELALEDRNPFALVTAAHLLTRQTKRDNERRLAAKWRLAKLLYERDWDRQRIIDLFGVIDWMMQVPMALQRRLWCDIEQLERNRKMPYITSVERIGIEKGIQQGIERGIEQGIERGIERGLQQGEVAVLERLIVRRFGPLSEATRIRLQDATLDQLGQWAENILDAASLEEVFASH